MWVIYGYVLFLIFLGKVMVYAICFPSLWLIMTIIGKIWIEKLGKDPKKIGFTLESFEDFKASKPYWGYWRNF